MADYASPTLTSTYSDLINVLKDRDVSSAKMFDGTTDTSLPTGTKKWNSSNNYFEKFDGSAWSPLTAKYMINVDLVDGCSVNDGGSTVNDLWTAFKVNSLLGAKLDTSVYTASDILTKIKTVDGTGSGLDADMVDGMSPTNTNVGSTLVSRDSSGNFSAGTVTANLTGNASSANTLSTPRNINNVPFNGSADITIYDTTKAPLVSPTFTGTPTAPTASSGTNSTQIATTAFATPRTSASGAAVIPSGTTAERPSNPINGYLRYNTDLLLMEGYINGVWNTIGGSTGITGGGTDSVFVENSKVITTNYTITSGKNAMSTGDITINTGVVVTIPTDSRWVIL